MNWSTSGRVAIVLRAAGWREGRTVLLRQRDIDRLDALHASAVVLDFLNEFSYLRFRGISHVSIGIGYGAPAIPYLSKLNIATNLTLWPIGSTNDGGDTMLLMDDKCNLFWWFEDLEFIGDSFSSAMEYLLFREPKQPVVPLRLHPGKWGPFFELYDRTST